MKRASSPHVSPPGKRLCNQEALEIASLVRLNVGGRRFEVSPETLSGAVPRSFFWCLLFLCRWVASLSPNRLTPNLQNPQSNPEITP